MQARHHIIIAWIHLAMVSHHRHRFHPFIHPCKASFRLLSPYGIISPFYTYPCTISQPHRTLPLLNHVATQSFPGWHQQYHILPHHYGESHPAPSLRGITSCPVHAGNTSYPIITGIIHHREIGSDKLSQFTRETTIVHTLTRNTRKSPS
jgi:hypothetical protein